ncbi:hypothetical protein KDH_43670 [Dictyobacter sp. S3.2.2.5]|uniref:Uncharacterized protein n=1 Tax=Dictyobacter halimunensis TaxID=3026934 RepID=A0ABQ6FTD8_9CHLR|nr:hypothetical protein KDH_43670 [Dictyobacter sp. S3.2.2.5]
MQRCDWCQKVASLQVVVNRDHTSAHAIDLVCSDCAELERFEHADEILWNPLQFTPSFRKPKVMAAIASH